MAKEKATSGFVYIWRDRKHNRYYIGSHWGAENDGYVCSSRWMRKSYSRRPEDFKRRILARVNTSRIDLLAEEHSWLNRIETTLLGKKYYNLRIDTMHLWHANDDSRLKVGEKISKALKGKPSKSSGKFKPGNAIGTKTQFSKGQIPHNLGKSFEDLYGDRAAEIKEKMSKARVGKSMINSGSFGNRPAWNIGLKRIYINNGIINKCIYGEAPEIPDGWTRGMAKKQSI